MKNVKVKAESILENDKWFLSVSVLADQGEVGKTISFEINGRKEEKSIKQESETFLLDPARVKEWFPFSPSLYTLKTVLDGECEDTAIAFYYYKNMGKFAFLNDRGIQIKACALKKGSGVEWESVIREASLLSLNAIVLEEDSSEIATLCLKMGLLPLLSEDVPSTALDIFLPPSVYGEYKSELNQSDSLVSSIIEAKERGRGFVIYYLNDTKEDIKGALTIDGKRKASAYSLSRFSSPLFPFISYKDSFLHLYVTNGEEENESIELSLKIRDYSGKKIEEKVYALRLQNHTTILVDKIKNDFDQKVFAYTRLSTKTVLRERTFLLAPFSASDMQDALITTHVTKIGPSTAIVTLRSKSPAFFVMLSSSVDGSFSDNLISIRPSAEKTVVFHSKEELDIKRFEESLKVRDYRSEMKE